MKSFKSFFLLALFFLLVSCAQSPREPIYDYDYGPKFSASGQFISFIRTVWEKGQITRAYLRLHDLYRAKAFTIAGAIEDFIWHPLEKKLYFLSGYSLYEADPDTFNRSHLYTFNYPAYGEFSIYGWLDGKTIVFKQNLPEQRPSGSYCILYDIQQERLTARYFLKDEGWAQIPSGDKYKTAKTSNKNVQILRDGKSFNPKISDFPLKNPKDYYSLEIRYGNMIYEMPLLVNGDFHKYQPFWSIEKDSLFFTSKNYFWRLDMKGLKLFKLGIRKNVQKGLKREWKINDIENPEIYIKEKEIPRDNLKEIAEQKPTPDLIIRSFFQENALVIEKKERTVSLNIKVLAELKNLTKDYSLIEISSDGNRMLFSRGGKIGVITLWNYALNYLTKDPIIITKSKLEK